MVRMISMALQSGMQGYEDFLGERWGAQLVE